MKNKTPLLLKYSVLKLKYKKLKRTYERLAKDFDYMFEENKILKGINKKRYVEQAKKMQFLVKRENTLQTIEQLVKCNDIDKAIELVMEEL